MLKRKIFCYSLFKRQLSLKHDYNLKRNNHPFKQIISKDSVEKHLIKNIIFQDDDIIVFNKPAGVGKSSPSHTSGKLIVPHTCSTIYMEDMLKNIAKQLPKCEKLRIVSFPERYTSGVMILATSEKGALKVEKCKRRAKEDINQCNSYLAISQGQPIIQRSSTKLALRLSANSVTKRQVPVLEDTWSGRDMKRQKVKLFRVAHTVISQGPLASLTQLSVSSSASNFIRLYFATKLLSPLLGDNIFSGRVQNVLGVPLLLDPWSDVANSCKRLPTNLLQALKLSSNESSVVPLCLHLAVLRLPKYNKGKDLILQASTPSTFNWVCQQLELHEPGQQKLISPREKT